METLSTVDAGSSGLLVLVGSKPTAAPHLTNSGSPATTPPSLETLPVELQCLILCNAPDLASLSALIHASPELHRTYVEHRRRVLRHLITQLLDGMRVDVLAAYHSGTEEFQNTRTEPLLRAFVEEQQAIHFTDPPTSPPASDWTAELPLDACISILRFHASVIEPLTEAFARWALDTLPSKAENEASKSASLSETERCRIQRAFYRMQMFCNVCGSRECGRRAKLGLNTTDRRVRILNMFPAWEVEEILSIHDFAKDYYRILFKQVARDLNEERNPKYRHIDKTSVHAQLNLVTELPGGYTRVHDRSQNTMLNHGLHLLANISKIKSREQLVEIVLTEITSREDSLGAYDFETEGWLDEFLYMGMLQNRRRTVRPNLYDSAQDCRQKTPFHGDNPGCPPLAWILFWQGEYSNLFGVFIPDELRRWGYIMWDAVRLDSDARDAIERTWKYVVDHCGADPRVYDRSSRVVDSPTSP
ncbi:hypothetical protein KVR01_009617 [Diaporthe batatas]|uniref:uncharacterized protein n=1 Tax=Diaporthe batatas TaxID=748121 RepID=UPI001D055F13|nr:uncharacterized protein KVR01_009617 [Diaporthe batatas]KAG8161353.1 hypothetical protein KVR01_009617 [Diaporthe batatas]